MNSVGDPGAATRFWVAKEAYAKMLGEGLKGNPKRFEISAAEGDTLIINDTRIQTTLLDGDFILGWTTK